MIHTRRRSRRLWLVASLSALTLGAVAAGVAASPVGGATNQAPIKIGVISTCKGPFAPFYEVTLAGATIPFLQHGGKKNGPNPSDGVSGVKAGDRPLQLVFGCSDATPDLALAEARRLIEQVKVDVLIAPLSGSEGIAIANYSKKQPSKTFLNGTSAAQDTTLKVRSPNFFRFGTDGAQWAAGLGDYAHNVLKWRTVVTVGDDYDFPYTQNAGFVAEFCSLGGKVLKRIWPPLGTKDYSSFVTQIPQSGIDGFFFTVGGTGTVAFLKAYGPTQTGNLAKRIIGGAVPFDPAVIGELGSRVEGAVIGVPYAPDSGNPETKRWVRDFKRYYPKLAPFDSLFSTEYWANTEPLIRALQAIKGDLSDGQKKLRAALLEIGRKGINTPNGLTRLDQNRNAIANNYIRQVTKVTKDAAFYKTLRTIPNVDQSFSGFFTTKTPTPSRTSPPCVKRKPPVWVGKSIPGPPKR